MHLCFFHVTEYDLVVVDAESRSMHIGESKYVIQNFRLQVYSIWKRLKWQDGDINLRRIELCTKVAQFSMSFSVVFKEGFLILCIFFCVYLNVSLIVRECK